MSHPTWVRGLKLSRNDADTSKHTSHPTWVRGLKQDGNHVGGKGQSRTPRGCVD